MDLLRSVLDLNRNYIIDKIINISNLVRAKHNINLVHDSKLIPPHCEIPEASVLLPEI